MKKNTMCTLRNATVEMWDKEKSTKDTEQEPSEREGRNPGRIHHEASANPGKYFKEGTFLKLNNTFSEKGGKRGLNG